jgi:hypothetical protein
METNAIGETYPINDPQQPLKIKMTTYVDKLNTHYTNIAKANNIELNMPTITIRGNHF